LAGNIRQWIVSGFGGESDRRDRSAEFARRERLPREQLVATLTAAVQEADAVIARSAALLGEDRPVQGREVHGFEAIYHGVEHFAMHTGQILYIAKLKSGKDLGFYRNVDGVVRPAWPGHPTEGSA